MSGAAAVPMPAGFVPYTGGGGPPSHGSSGMNAAASAPQTKFGSGSSGPQFAPGSGGPGKQEAFPNPSFYGSTNPFPPGPANVGASPQPPVPHTSTPFGAWNMNPGLKHTQSAPSLSPPTQFAAAPHDPQMGHFPSTMPAQYIAGTHPDMVQHTGAHQMFAQAQSPPRDGHHATYPPQQIVSRPLSGAVSGAGSGKSRGPCCVCGLEVYSAQERKRLSDGRYAHFTCGGDMLEMVAPPAPQSNENIYPPTKKQEYRTSPNTNSAQRTYRGVCVGCGQDVFSDQMRRQLPDGSYAHEACVNNEGAVDVQALQNKTGRMDLHGSQGKSNTMGQLHLSQSSASSKGVCQMQMSQGLPNFQTSPKNGTAGGTHPRMLRGKCVVCGGDVWSDEGRRKLEDGRYCHEPCFALLNPNASGEIANFPALKDDRNDTGERQLALPLLPDTSFERHPINVDSTRMAKPITNNTTDFGAAPTALSPEHTPPPMIPSPPAVSQPAETAFQNKNDSQALSDKYTNALADSKYFSNVKEEIM